MKTVNAFLVCLLGLFLIISGCSKENTDDFVQEDLANEVELAEGGELKCTRGDGTITIRVFARLSSTSDLSLPPVTCVPEEYGFTLAGGGNTSGYATLLGRVNEELSTYVLDDCAFASQTQLVLNSHGQMSGRRGDLYYINVVNNIDLTTQTFTGTVVIEGGTGRFEGATGTVHMVDGVMHGDGTSSWKGYGTMTLQLESLRRRRH